MPQHEHRGLDPRSGRASISMVLVATISRGARNSADHAYKKFLDELAGSHPARGAVTRSHGGAASLVLRSVDKMAEHPPASAITLTQA